MQKGGLFFWLEKQNVLIPSKKGENSRTGPHTELQDGQGAAPNCPPPLQEPHLGPGYSQGLRGSVPFSVPLTSDGSSAGVTPQLHTPIR